MLKFFLSMLIGVFVSSYAVAQEKLIFAIDIIRHGDRTPVIPSPEMQKIWPQGAGQLTPRGMRQEYELGKKLREQYINHYHLLPKKYDTSTMKVRSSGMTRTMMSAQSLLLGIYPLGTGPSLPNSTKNALPKGFQPIPINIVPREQDSLLLPYDDKETYKHLLEEYVFNNPEWIQKDLELKPNYARWSSIAGIQIDNLFDVIYFSDRLFIERLYNLPLPQDLQKTEADKIINAGTWAFLNIASQPHLASLIGNELAQTIQHELKLATEQNRPLKYLLFVAHDTTILAQLKLLGQTIHDAPPYASRINYSLFDSGSSNYIVRITYNQTPLFIEQCGGESCTLNQFINLIESRQEK